MIELYVLPTGIPDDLERDRPIVIIDVYRVGTSIAAALEAGASAVYVAGSMQEADMLKARIGGQAVMAGERGGLKIDGYHLGNSPLEMTPEAVRGRPVIFNSTNGTRLLRRFENFPHVAVGSLVCLAATVRYINHFDHDPILCCAGQLNRFSAEDTLAAGMILSALVRPDDAFDDASLTAKRLVALSGESWKDWARRSSHGRTLTSLGLTDDPDYCLGIDRFDFVPVKKNGLFVRYVC